MSEQEPLTRPVRVPAVARRRLVCVGLASVVSLLGVSAAADATTTTTRFLTPGAYEFTVPPGVSRVTVVAVGGAGGDCGELGRAGRGAAVTAEVPATAGQQLFVGVAGSGGDCVDHVEAVGGVGGGGRGGLGGFVSAGGGGASIVSAGSQGVQGALVVAGGGGGGGSGNYFAGFLNPGADADAGAATGMSGGAGTLTTGGRAGSGGRPEGSAEPGAAGVGGAGGNNFTTQCYAGDGGGGGGAGYFGGGGGAACKDDLSFPVAMSTNGGGGGGSSFLHASATALLAPQPASVAPGVSFTYPAPAVTRSLSRDDTTLTVSNRGSAPLVVSGVLLAGADPEAFAVGAGCRRPVARRSSCTLEVGLVPRERGARFATLRLLTNAPSAPKPVKLSAVRGDGPRGRDQATPRTTLISCPVPATHAPRYDDGGPPVCRGRRVVGEVELTRSGAKAVLRRGGVTYATGVHTANADGSSLLALDERRTLKRGMYTLVMQGRSERVEVRPNVMRGWFPRLSGLVF